MNIIEVYPTKIHKTQLDIDHKVLSDSILHLKNHIESVQISNKGGWQTPIFFSGDHEFLNNLINQVENFVLPIANEHKKIESLSTQYWFNINEPKSYNSIHNHSGTYLSAVFYVTVPEHSGDICFHNPFAPMPEVLKTGVYIKPFANDLIVFPGYMPHSVGINKSAAPRISIAFNCNAIIKNESL